MNQQMGAALKIDDDPFAAPACADNSAANDSVIPGFIPMLAQSFRAHSNLSNALAAQQRTQIANHGFDFGQLRHGAPRADWWRLYRACAAVLCRLAALDARNNFPTTDEEAPPAA